MNGIIVASAMALLGAALLVASRLYAHRDFDDLIRAILRIGEATRVSLERVANVVTERRGKPPEPKLTVKNWGDLAIFLWNSRLFSQMGNHAILLAPGDEEIKFVSGEILGNNQKLRKLVFFAFGEKLLSLLLSAPAAHYQNEAMACYAESERQIYYLVSTWRPEDEKDLEGRF